jgi:hypothetical protein
MFSQAGVQFLAEQPPLQLDPMILESRLSSVRASAIMTE